MKGKQMSFFIYNKMQSLDLGAMEIPNLQSPELQIWWRTGLAFKTYIPSLDLAAASFFNVWCSAQY